MRGHKIILDHDLAELYGVSTKALNQAMKRNSQRFPDEFVFRLTQEEENSLRSQFVTLNDSAGARDSIPNQSQIVTGSLEASSVNILRSQIVTSKETRGGRRYLPFAFTEHGVLMAANVLRSRRAIQMSVLIVQTFVRLQRMVASVDALARKVEELERATQANRDEIKKIVTAIRQLMTPLEKPRREIGFHTRPETTDPAARRHRRSSPKARKRTDPAATK